MAQPDLPRSDRFPANIKAEKVTIRIDGDHAFTGLGILRLELLQLARLQPGSIIFANLHAVSHHEPFCPVLVGLCKDDANGAFIWLLWLARPYPYKT
jgi:hypothetical protein